MPQGVDSTRGMSIIGGTNLASALAGTQQAERVTTRETKREEEARRKGVRRWRDEQDIAVVRVEMPEAARAATGNGQEETHSEREASAGYTAGGTPVRENPPSLDIEG